MTNVASDSVSTGGFANEQLAEWQTSGKGGTTEGGQAYDRSSLFGEKIVQNLHGVRTPMLAKEGSMWVATNVPGTPIVDPNASGFVATTPAMVLFNNNPTGGAWIYPVRFKHVATAAGTSSTTWDVQWIIDTGNRYTSGGTALTPVNVNPNVLSTKTGAVIHFGAVTAPAANASRIVYADRVRTVIKVIGDETIFEFGGSTPMSVGMPTDGTLQLSKVCQVPAIALPPQCSLLYYEYGASQGTAAQFDMLVLEYAER
jgi:hypothetical protein